VGVDINVLRLGHDAAAFAAVIGVEVGKRMQVVGAIQGAQRAGVDRLIHGKSSVNDGASRLPAGGMVALYPT